MTSPEWEALRVELEATAGAARAFNAYVFDAWDNMHCAARGFTQVPRDDLLDLVHAASVHAHAPLRRGGKLDVALAIPMYAYVKTYGSCYVLLLRFSGPFDTDAVRSAVAAALQRIEQLTLALPPSGGPGTDGHEAAKRA